MSKLELVKNEQTIRQMPENYLIAEKIQSRWVCDPDGAADRVWIMKMTIALFIHNNRFGPGKLLVDQVNAMADVTGIQTHDRALELYYGRACNCDMCTDEVSRTLDELLDNERAPICPCCEVPFELVTIIDHVDIKKLVVNQNNT